MSIHIPGAGRAIEQDSRVMTSLMLPEAKNIIRDSPLVSQIRRYSFHERYADMGKKNRFLNLSTIKTSVRCFRCPTASTSRKFVSFVEGCRRYLRVKRDLTALRNPTYAKRRSWLCSRPGGDILCSAHFRAYLRTRAGEMQGRVSTE